MSSDCRVNGRQYYRKLTPGLGSRFSFVIPAHSVVETSKDKTKGKALFIINDSKYESLIKSEAERFGLSVTAAESTSEATMLDEQYDLIFYCYHPHHSSRRDLASLRARFNFSEIIGLQHHLFMLPDAEALVSSNLTLPFLGSRFEAAIIKHSTLSRSIPVTLIMNSPSLTQ